MTTALFADVKIDNKDGEGFYWDSRLFSDAMKRGNSQGVHGKWLLSFIPMATAISFIGFLHFFIKQGKRILVIIIIFAGQNWNKINTTLPFVVITTV
ncbi:MAG TPA: hypothetical protein DDZ04_03665 [Parabacteroides sp.]|nr:hypothetical protein [Parabacteroides sp.]